MVYEAFDRQENSLVALKVLRFAEADALYRFKKGFRSLADIRHPNLVSFYELFTEGGLWFFSMELVPGVDFIEHLTGVPAESTPATEPLHGSRVGVEGDEGWQVVGAEESAPRSPDYAKIRSCVLQLARGLQALHADGKVHRDIKPPNVLVTADGRVILLDFGLVAELAQLDGPPAANPQLVGTPAYMSPESALALPGSPASDWYSVGVMVYQAVAGELPFKGSLAEIFASKQVSPPPEIRSLVPDVPDDIEALCRGLLEPEGEQRLTGEQVLALLSGSADSETSVGRGLPAPETTFVGRREHLDSLMAAFEESRWQTTVTFLGGASGMGKTALLHRFAQMVRDREPEAVVLSGRCYLQESVPYKALDSIVDSLSRFLTGLEPRQVEVLLPTHLSSLVRLFPVLLRVEAIAELEFSEDGPSDPKTLRRRGFSALGELLARLAARRRVVLLIDDLQWGDTDSFYVLDDLFRSPDPPALLMVASYRSEDRLASPLLRALSEPTAQRSWSAVSVRRLEVGPLRDGEARKLLEALEDLGAPLADELSGTMSQLDGNPLFLTELVRYSRARRQGGASAIPATDSAELQLRDLILARVEELPASGRRLLEVIAVAGKPVDLEAARTAAEITTNLSEVVAQLRTWKLIRQLPGDDHVEVETYHDRIRETVSLSLSNTTLRRIHGELARALESVGRTDPETLAVHFQATEERAQARRYVISAAERAERTLAFDRAARLYRLALDLLAADSADRYELRVKLGSALANSGHSREAADTFIEAVGDSGTINPLEVQRHAAEKLLISGHIDRGMAVLRHVLRNLDMTLERRPWRSLLQLWWLRLRLRLRGLEFDERPEPEVDPEKLQRIDVCWSVEIGLCLVDMLHASEFHARHLLLALEAGEPQRIARGLAMEVFFGAIEGGDVESVLERAQELAGRVPGRYAASLTEMAAGMNACAEGRWRQADKLLSRAEDHLRESRGGVVWELDTVQHFQILARLHLGQWRDLFEEAPRQLERASEQGDLYLEIHWLHWVESLRLMAADRDDEARDLLLRSIGRWSYDGFHFQHLGHLHAESQLALYQGRFQEAHDQVEDRWRSLTRSLIQRIDLVLILSYDLRGRVALALAVVSEGGGRRRLLELAEGCAKRLERASSSWPLGLASLLRAGVASVRRDAERTREHLEVAISAFDAGSMTVHGLVARLRRAQVAEADEGRIAAAGQALRDLGLVRPRRLASVLSPGAWEIEIG